jgi:hypothetical protein
MAQRGTTAEIDLAELEKLAAMQATDEEIAAWFGVTTRTIERRRQEQAFAEVMERGKAKGRLSMRRAQMKLLEQGNATMGVWLGKQYLGQSDETRRDFGNTYLAVCLPSFPATVTGSAGSDTGQPLIEGGSKPASEIPADDPASK